MIFTKNNINTSYSLFISHNSLSATIFQECVYVSAKAILQWVSHKI